MQDVTSAIDLRKPGFEHFRLNLESRILELKIKQQRWVHKKMKQFSLYNLSILKR
jgi:hypothetical protein